FAKICADRASGIARNNGGGIGNIVGHCVAGYEFSRCMGPLGGTVPADVLNDLYEFTYGLYLNTLDAIRDTRSAANGGGMEDCGESCSDQCRKQYPGSPEPSI